MLRPGHSRAYATLSDKHSFGVRRCNTLPASTLRDHWFRMAGLARHLQCLLPESKTMRVAIATWNGRISPVFDVARQVLLVEFDAGRIAERRDEMLPGTDPASQADRLRELGVEFLICGAVSQPMAAMLAAKGVEIVPFTAGPVEQLLAAWMAGGLPAPTWCMPGCRGRMRRFRCGASGRRGQGRWSG